MRGSPAWSRLPPPLQLEVGACWEAWHEASQAAGITLPAPLLETLIPVWAGSAFVAQTMLRYPHLLLELYASGALSCAAPNLAHDLEQQLTAVADVEQLSGVLRRWRQRQMLRIAYRDLAGWADLDATMRDLSSMAEVAIRAALQRLQVWQAQRYGEPRNAAGAVQSLLVLGMGKLGGQELNFSSDIDLIFAYTEAGETDGIRSISNEEFFRRLGQGLRKVLDEVSADGWVFRVDLRLRPFGESGPLVLSSSALESYYQQHGRDWERYALIKARVLAGDAKAGQHLLAALHPFVYRRYLDYHAFAALREMKLLIAQQVERHALQDNIKLGPGGIREIEFIGQVFQLIYGGREPALRQPSILPVLETLALRGRLPRHAVTALQAAYTFLRRMENRLQMWADQQTHDLPKDDLGRLRLAYSMGYPSWDACAQVLAQHRQAVSAQFALVFGAAPAATNDHALGAWWQGAAKVEEALPLLTAAGFHDALPLGQRLQALRASRQYLSMSQRGRERFDHLLPKLLHAAAATTSASATATRLLDLLEAIARRSVYLALLAEQPAALAQLVKLCAASSWIARHLTRYPLLLDDLLNPALLYAPLDAQQLERELEQQLQRAASADAEEVLNLLCHFKHTQTLRVAAADVSGAMPLMVVSDHLTALAETLLRKVLALAWADLLPRFGQPRCVVQGVEREAQLAIVAYGKLGGWELNYGSDLDLVFLHDSCGEQQHTSGPQQIENAAFFTRLVQRMIHWLTTRTAAGALYEIDTRLRPSGGAGLLVSSLPAFSHYQQQQAWVWEHQALVRARVVAGAPQLAQSFAAIRQQVLQRQRDPDRLRREVREMRERMRAELDTSNAVEFDLKQGSGGIVDLEFMVQYALLQNAQRYPTLLTYTDNMRQLEALEACGMCAEAAALRDAYRGLRRHLHLAKLQEQDGRVAYALVGAEREIVLRWWRQCMGEPPFCNTYANLVISD